MTRRFFYPALGLFLIVIDQISKKIASNETAYTCNKGISWGVQIPGFLFALLWLFVIGCLVYAFSQITSRWSNLGIILIISGAVSNLVDRAFHGCVIDFIQTFSWYPVFNIADALITIGAIIVVLSNIKAKKDAI